MFTAYNTLCPWSAASEREKLLEKMEETSRRATEDDGQTCSRCCVYIKKRISSPKFCFHKFPPCECRHKMFVSDISADDLI